MKKCVQCGKEWEPKNPKGKFCSDKCKVKWHRKGGLKTIDHLEDGTKVQMYIPDGKVHTEKINIKWVKQMMPKGLSLTEQLEWREKNP